MASEIQQDATSRIDEAARRKFEAAWRAGKPEPIDNFLPAKDSSNYRATLEELVHIEIELAWKGQASPNGAAYFPFPVEEYASRYPELNEPAILRRLVRQEFQCRQRAGAKPGISEYRARFPKLPFNDDELEPTVAPPVKPAEVLPTIPGYEILGVLGKGGMGLVLKAKQISLGRIVAIKQIVTGAAASEEELKRFKNEAATIARLQHPNIVQIHEVGDAGGRPFLVLEFVDGGSLDKKMAGTPFHERQAAEMTALLARAVFAVHQKGILHRDLKPHNVLLTADGMPKITDFGLAKQFERRTETSGASLTETGVVVGTPSYMAPEQAAGKSQIGPAVDIYALGTILYEMITGRPPFRGATAMETIGQVLSEEAISPRRLRRELPRDLETICMKCLQKEPHRRYPTAQELAEDLERFLLGEAIRARPVGRAERLWRWCKRKPAQAMLSAALIVAGVSAVLGFFFWMRADHERRQQSLEFTVTKKQDALRRRESLRNKAQTQQRLALAELRAGQFQNALTFLAQGLDEVRDEPELKDVRRTLESRHDQVKRLVDFYYESDRAERRAFLEDDDTALKLCEKSLHTVKVFDHRTDWWLHLPVEDLSVSQREKLARDINHQLLLVAGLWVKEAIMGTPRPGVSPTKNALEALALVEAYHKAQKLEPPMAGQFLELFARHGFAAVRKTKDLMGKEPITASDCYLVGVCYFWAGLIADHPLSRVMLPMLKNMGLDTPKITDLAQRYLRRAAAEEPGHYWSHFWLAWILKAGKDFKGAELAFNNCVVVRPNYSLGYAERAETLAVQHETTTDEGARLDLRRRCRADIQKALALDRHDLQVQILRLNVAWRFKDRDEFRQALIDLLDLIPPAPLASSGQRLEHALVLKAVERDLEQPVTNPSAEAEVKSFLARVRHSLQKDKAALEDAHKALELKADGDNYRRALFVRGFAALNRKDPAKALADFDEVLAREPANFHAARGRALAQEAAKDWDKARQSYDALLQLAVVDWQRLEALLGAARVFHEMGKIPESRQALERATELHPNAAGLLNIARRQ